MKRNDGYAFEGNSVSAKGTSFHYKGKVANGEMEIDITDVQIPANPLTAQGTWKMPVGESDVVSVDNGNTLKDYVYTYTHGAFITWHIPDEEENEMAEGTMRTFNLLVHNILYLLLDELTFHPDGNITASYINGLPEDMGSDFMLIMKLIMGHVEETDRSGEAQQSPINLIKYFVDGETVSVVPDVEMIMRLIEANKQMAAQVRLNVDGNDNEGSIEIDIETIKEIYGILVEWANNGVKLQLRPKTQEDISTKESGTYRDTYHYYNGDYLFFLPGEEVAFLQPYLPLLPGILPENVTSMPLVGELLEQVIELFMLVDEFQVGFILYDNQVTNE